MIIILIYLLLIYFNCLSIKSFLCANFSITEFFNFYEFNPKKIKKIDLIFSIMNSYGNMKFEKVCIINKMNNNRSYYKTKDLLLLMEDYEDLDNYIFIFHK